MVQYRKGVSFVVYSYLAHPWIHLRTGIADVSSNHVVQLFVIFNFPCLPPWDHALSEVDRGG